MFLSVIHPMRPGTDHASTTIWRLHACVKVWTKLSEAKPRPPCPLRFSCPAHHCGPERLRLRPRSWPRPLAAVLTWLAVTWQQHVDLRVERDTAVVRADRAAFDAGFERDWSAATGRPQAACDPAAAAETRPPAGARRRTWKPSSPTVAPIARRMLANSNA